MRTNQRLSVALCDGNDSAWCRDLEFGGQLFADVDRQLRAMERTRTAEN